MALWHHDNAATLRRTSVTGIPLGIDQIENGIRALSGIDGVCDIVPEFELLAKPYQDILNSKYNYKYFRGFIDATIATGKYEVNDNIQALPYDFRRVLDPLFRENMFHEMRRQVESMHSKYGPVVIVGHSLGAVLFKWFLSSKVDAKWAKTYVKRLFIVNAPFGGSNTALKAIMSGEYFVPIFSKQFHSSLQLNSGIIMCFPNVHGYELEEPLAIVNKKVVSPETLEREHSGTLFQTRDAFDAWYHLYKPHMECIMETICVPTHIVTCMPTLDTLKTFKLREVGGGDVEEIASELGDGQVSARSLNVAYSLFDSSTMLKTTIDGCHHINIICDPRFAQLVLEEALD